MKSGPGVIQMLPHPDEIVEPLPGIDYENLMLGPGDGSVTKHSFLARDEIQGEFVSSGNFPIEYAVFVCEKHKHLTGNITFQENLLNSLLIPNGPRRKEKF